MYLTLVHHSVHGTAAALTPVSWQLCVAESSVVVAMSSGDAEATVRLVAAFRRWQHSSLDRISVSLSVVMAAQVNLIVRAVIPTYLL